MPQAKTVVLVFAMEEEARPLLEALDFTPFELPARLTRFPFRFFVGRFGSLTLVVAHTGKDARYGRDLIGTEPATLTAFAAHELFSPDVMVSVGTVGALVESAAEIGEVFLSKSFSYHDHRIPIAGWREMGKGDFPSFDTSSMAKELGLRVASISTRNSLDESEVDLENLRRSGAVLEDMESAALAWVCSLSATPFFAIKVVANHVTATNSAADEFEKNLPKSVLALKEAILRVLKRLG